VGAEGVITHRELVQARERLLEQAVSFFTSHPDPIGIFLAGSLAAGSGDAYSDIDLRIIAPPEGQARLVEGRLEWPAHWGDLLFNEWLDGTQHCVSHFRPFLKIDVFYWTPSVFRPSPWFRMPAKVFLDRDGLVRSVLAQSQSLTFSPPSSDEVSRVLSKALAGAHEVVRRTRRGELHFAQSLLEELRSNMTRLDAWIQGFEPSAPPDLKLAARLSPTLAHVFERSYVGLNAADIDDAVVGLSTALTQQISELHRQFELNRPLTFDMAAVDLVTTRQIA
jgi:predicted nucleotidyltransferase